jgi:phosphoribosylformylglycinamidine cyclo-ligase
MAGRSREPLTYAAAGVDLTARRGIVERYKEVARRASGPQVLGGIGPFAGMFAFDAAGYGDPVLVATTDTVGTKGKLAALAGGFESLGHDIVNHCINDALTTGARPLFFLDTIVNAGLDDDAKVAMVKGVTDACIDAGCVLLGGETADMPGVYVPGGFDLVGFVLGVVERARLIDGTKIEAGDVLLALPSNGLHTNGYSLARPALGIGVDGSGEAADGRRLERYEEQLGETLAEALLRPHRSYLREIEPALSAERPLIKGMAHITGGGLYENVPRILPRGLGAAVRKGAVTPPPIFEFIRQAGRIEEAEMYRVFNMGFGMIIAASPADVPQLQRLVPDATVCGEVVSGAGVRLE